MSVRLRLQRFGAKKRPYYRLVVADQRAARDGRFRELLGTYDPMVEPNVADIKLDRVDYWLGVGAQPTERVESVIRNYREGKYVTTAAYVEANKERRNAARNAALNAKPVEAAVAKVEAKQEVPVAEAAEEAAAAEPVAEAAAEPVAEAAVESNEAVEAEASADSAETTES